MINKFYGNIVAGSKGITIPVLLRSSTDNSETIGKVAADINVFYYREGGLPINVSVFDLVSLDLPHSPGGWKEIDSVNQKGLYRLDIPDAAVDYNSDWVVISIVTPGSFTFYERYNLRGLESFSSEILNTVTSTAYCTITDAQNYFDLRLDTRIWDNATNADR